MGRVQEEGGRTSFGIFKEEKQKALWAGACRLRRGMGGRGGLKRGRATQGQREESPPRTQHRCEKRKDGAIAEGFPEEVA